MLIKYFFKKLQKKNYPIPSKERCLNNRYRFSKCSKCKDVCPVQAIKWEQDSIIIDENSCTSCGICRSICPSKAIKLKNFGEISALNRAKEKDSLIVECAQGNKEESIKFSCLHGLQEEYLIAFVIILKKKIYFDLSKCKLCTYKKNYNDFLSFLEKIGLFLKALNLDFDYEILNHEEEDGKYAKDKLSRREFFLWIKTSSLYLGRDAAIDAIKNIDEDEFNERKLLLDTMSALKNVKEQYLSKDNGIFRSYHLNATCDGCGACAAICPWNAWEIEEEDKKITIKHNASLCKACNLCESVCLEAAIQKVSFPVNLLFKGYTIKKEIVLAYCKHCSDKYVPKIKNFNLCTKCEKMKNRNTSSKDNSIIEGDEI